MNPTISNPKDHIVVSFHNNTDFIFTPQMGCMYDGRAINGKSAMEGSIPGGIDVGETMQLPYHIGNQLALNLAKISMMRMAPRKDVDGIPTGVPLWDEPKLMETKASFITELYTDAKPIAQSQTDILMAKVEALNKMVEGLTGKTEIPTQPAPVITSNDIPPVTTNTVYQDKAEVIAELTKRNVVHDKRKNKSELEKLLA